MFPEVAIKDKNGSAREERLLLIAPNLELGSSCLSNSGGRAVKAFQSGYDLDLEALRGDWDVVVFTTGLGRGASPGEVMEELRIIAPEATFLAICEKPDIREAVDYLKGGVFEYLPLPFSDADFSIALTQAFDNNDAYREIVALNRLLVEEKEGLAAKNRELTAISTVARAVSHSLELDDVLERLVECVEATFEFDRVTVGLVNAAERKEYSRVSRGHNALATSGAAWDISAASDCPWVETVFGKGMAINHRLHETDPLSMASSLVKLHSTPLAKVPMVVRGNVVGSITVDNHRSGQPIGEEEVKVLKVFADTAAIAVENSRLYLMVRELSLRDELTGLYNRRFLMERAEAELNNAERRGFCLSLIVLDLDHFKILNDANDHLTGDAALKKVARVLEGMTRGIDIVARYGGEEMVVLLPSTELADGVKVAEKLRTAIEEAQFEGEEALPSGKLTVSVGVAAYPMHGRVLRELFEQADHAMYTAKRLGRNRVVSADDPACSQG